jgi:predicted GNAT family acetyltransferase
MANYKRKAKVLHTATAVFSKGAKSYVSTSSAFTITLCSFIKLAYRKQHKRYCVQFVL